jgi:hypothetical protein
MDKIEIYNEPAQNCASWNRTLCSVLQEMRKCYETRNFAILPGLIEEAQTYGNRMEAKLADVQGYEHLKQRYKSLQKKVAKIPKEEGDDRFFG